MTVKEMIEDTKVDLKLEVVCGEEGLNNEIVAHDINRPGLAVAGYVEFFGSERIQVLGKGEIAHLGNLTKEKRIKILEGMFKHKISCFIVSWDQKIPEELIKFTKENKVPLLRTSIPTGMVTALLTFYLERMFAPEINIHGNLVEVHGVGVLLLGDSGIGKSECALELVERGQRLVADDVVKIKRVGPGQLLGFPSEQLEHHMEIRGLGIIDLKEMFGVTCVSSEAEIELAVYLEMWNPETEYDRLGLDEKTIEMLGVNIPEIIIPLQPGRNIAVIVEVAAMNQRLKKMGKFSAKDFDQKLRKRLTKE
ncbi:MAG: HPr(Ser) kinase/phosphatase [bacterium]|nr:HPr(Ser) kinase/phosphatase [bacterium]